MQHPMEAFKAIADIPRAVGAIDCTHVKIANPGGDHAVQFINHKGYFSLNCQFTCMADLIFTSIGLAAHMMLVYLESAGSTGSLSEVNHKECCWEMQDARVYLTCSPPSITHEEMQNTATTMHSHILKLLLHELLE